MSEIIAVQKITAMNIFAMRGRKEEEHRKRIGHIADTYGIDFGAIDWGCNKVEAATYVPAYAISVYVLEQMQSTGMNVEKALAKAERYFSNKRNIIDGEQPQVEWDADEQKWTRVQ